jgi:DNA-binding MarR family transcriptional regulator
MPARRSPAGDLLTELVLKVFRLNGDLLAVADRIAGGSGLTAARWQVLGAVLPEPLSVAGVARNMGLTRQSVQRLADLLVEEGLCAYQDNPAHRRAKLLAPSADGWAAIERIRPVQSAWANKVAAKVGEKELRAASDTVDAILAALATPAGQLDEVSVQQPQKIVKPVS